jgi:hypothetical protein
MEVRAGKPFPVLHLRRQCGWSQVRLVAELQQVVVVCGHPVPEKRALKELVTGWERGLPRAAFHRELRRRASLGECLVSPTFEPMA